MCKSSKKTSVDKNNPLKIRSKDQKEVKEEEADQKKYLIYQSQIKTNHQQRLKWRMAQRIKLEEIHNPIKMRKSNYKAK